MSRPARRAAAHLAMVLALAIAAAGLHPAPSGASSSVSWGPIGTVSPPGADVVDPTLAAALDGRLLAAWRSDADDSVQVSWRTAAGSWGPSTTLSSPPAGFDETAPAIAVASDGTAVAAWLEWATASDDSRVVARRWTGSSWSGVEVVETSSSLLTDLEVEAGPGGVLVATWIEEVGALDTGRGAVWSGGSWSTPDTFDTALESGSPARAAVGPGGAVVVVWGVVGWPPEVRASWWTGSGWGPFARVSGDVESRFPDVAIRPDGTAVAVLQRNDGSEVRIVASFWDGSAWSTPVPISAAGQIALEPQVVVDPSSRVTATWLINAITSQRVGAASISGATWSAPVTVTPVGDDVFRHETAVGPDGTVAIAYEEVDAGDVRALLQRPGGPWEAPTTVSNGTDFAEQPHVAVAPTGRIEVIWSSFPSGGVSTVERRSGTIAGQAPPGPFADVPTGTFFTEPVRWARDVGYTTGVGGQNVFEPNRSITRAETITLLWRIAGEPAAVGSGFADVPTGTFFSTAVGWARATGLTTGVGGQNVFEPDRDITRAEVVTLLWRQAGEPGAPASGFTDVPTGTFFSAAVGWAREIGLTTGVGGQNVFEPDRSITRAETITLLWRLVATPTHQSSALP